MISVQTMDGCSRPLPTLQIPHVLLADADLEQQQLYDCWLTTSGCRVTQAREGFEALAIGDLDPPDVIVTRVYLPDMDGLELCDRLRADRRERPLPAVVLLDRGMAGTRDDDAGDGHGGGTGTGTVCADRVILAGQTIPPELAILYGLETSHQATLLAAPCAPHTLMTTIHARLRGCQHLRHQSLAARQRAAVLCRLACELEAVSLEHLAHQRPGWHRLLEHVRQDYATTPFLTLTPRLAAARWQISETQAQLALECLRRRELLQHTADGAFTRTTAPAVRPCA